MSDDVNKVPVYAEPEGIDYIIIKVKENVINGDRGGNLYETTRRAWRAKLETAKPYKYVLSVVGGIVQEVYSVSRWYTSPTDAPRIEFEGEVAEFNVRNLFVGRMIPECYRQKGLASPFLYKRKSDVPVVEHSPKVKPEDEALKAAALKKAEEAAIKAKAEAQAAVAAKAKAEAEAKAKAELEAKAKAELEAKSKAEMELKAKTIAEAKAKALAEVEAKTSNAAKCEDNGDGKYVLRQGNNKIFFKINTGLAEVVSEYDGVWDEEPEGSITIPDAVKIGESICKVTAVGRLAFANCTKITKVTLSSNIKQIDEKAFYGCTSLQSIDFKNVDAIGQSAFEGCTSLQSIDFKNVNDIGQSAFEGCTGLWSIDFMNVNTIGESVFKGCTDLRSIDFKNVNTIGSSAFYGCTGLQSIDFKNVTTIGRHAFDGCKGLVKVIIPSGVSVIPDYAFDSCEKLEKVIIPASVEKIGRYAFEHCYALGNVVIPNKRCYVDTGAFRGIKGQIIC